MFNSISGRYDFLDHFMSFRMDNYWRKKVVEIIRKDNPSHILDVATGTADLAIAIAKGIPDCKITGIDIADKMLDYGRKKIDLQHLNHQIELFSGDAEEIEFNDNTFDAISISFGVRNFENLEKGLSEMKRVLKSGKKLVILEFSLPQKSVAKWLYLLYFAQIVPFIGKFISKNNYAYYYLPNSVRNFPYGDEFVNILLNLGFKSVEQTVLNKGICTIYACEK